MVIGEEIPGRMWRRMDESAQRALAAAASAAAASYVTPEHLLVALLSEPESDAAARLRALGVDVGALARRAAQHVPEAAAAGEQPLLTPRTLRIVELALTEASRDGEGHITPLRLLCGIAREGRSEAALLLRKRGVTLEALAGEPAESRTMLLPLRPAAPPRDPPPVPGAIGWVTLAAAVDILWSLVMIFMACAALQAPPTGLGPLALSLLVGPPGSHRTEAAILGSCCSVVTWAVFAGPLPHGYRWTWSAATGMLFVRSASSAAGTALLLSRALGQPYADGAVFFLALCALKAALILTLTIRLFRAREFFGIGERNGWRTLFRDGWWALLLTTVFEGAYLMTFALEPLR